MPRITTLAYRYESVKCRHGPDRIRQAVVRLGISLADRVVKPKINANNTVDTAMSDIDAEYEALCASMQLVTV